MIPTLDEILAEMENILSWTQFQNITREDALREQAELAKQLRELITKVYKRLGVSGLQAGLAESNQERDKMREYIASLSVHFVEEHRRWQEEWQCNPELSCQSR